jgi:hypothetical protein
VPRLAAPTARTAERAPLGPPAQLIGGGAAFAGGYRIAGAGTAVAEQAAAVVLGTVVDGVETGEINRRFAGCSATPFLRSSDSHCRRTKRRWPSPVSGAPARQERYVLDIAADELTAVGEPGAWCGLRQPAPGSSEPQHRRATPDGWRLPPVLPLK